MNSTSTELKPTTENIISVVVPIILLIISEILPFVPNRYNGILQTISVIIKDFWKYYILS
jgi:hypothetical protein